MQHNKADPRRPVSRFTTLAKTSQALRIFLTANKMIVPPKLRKIQQFSECPAYVASKEVQKTVILDQEVLLLLSFS